jgi:hypothetical protein
MKGEKTFELTSILQGPDEPYQEFVACLLQNVGRTVADTEARNILVKQLAFRMLTRPVRQPFSHTEKRVTLQEMIRICADIRPSHIQGIALAAALKEVFHPGAGCFSCGKEEHFARECWNKS